MRTTDLISATFAIKDLSIKEMLSAIRNTFTTFTNNNFLFFSYRMEVDSKLETFNPWKVENIDLLSRM